MVTRNVASFEVGFAYGHYPQYKLEQRPAFPEYTDGTDAVISSITSMTATATQVVDSPETSATIRIAMRLDGGSLTGASDADISRELTDQSPHAIGGDVDNWFTYESDHQSEPHPIFASKIVLGVIAPWTLFGKDNTKIRVEVTDVSFDYTLLSEISASTASATGITDSRATLHGALTGDGNGLDVIVLRNLILIQIQKTMGSLVLLEVLLSN